MGQSKLKRVKHISSIIALIGLSNCPASYSFESDYHSYEISYITDNPKEVIDQAWQIVFRDFLDSSGLYTVEKWKKVRKQVLSSSYADKSEAYEAIRNMLATLDDPYTRFLDPKEFKEMRIDTSGELTGVGIQLSLDKDTKELTVVSPIDNTPAAKAGIKSNDIIVLIDGVSTKGMSIENAVKLIRGKQGSPVTLGIERDGKSIFFRLIRDRIEINAVNIRLNQTDYGKKIGYIRLRQFNANAAKEMKKALKGLQNQGVNGYVLDLRSNPGGLLEASVDIARQWINKGIIVSTKTTTGREVSAEPLAFLISLIPFLV